MIVRDETTVYQSAIEFASPGSPGPSGLRGQLWFWVSGNVVDLDDDRNVSGENRHPAVPRHLFSASFSAYSSWKSAEPLMVDVSQMQSWDSSYNYVSLG